MQEQVNVVVDAPSTSDLNEAMMEIREKYESLIAKNKKEIELWYNKKVSRENPLCVQQLS